MEPPGWASSESGHLFLEEGFMNTLALVLSACIGQPGEEAPMPLWQRDYTQAQKKAAEMQKPLAVFLAPGQDGMEKLIPGGLSNQAREMMANKFICVRIDTSTPEGKRWAQAFEIGDMGIVISDRGGNYQAFWHQGALTIPSLVRQLQRNADQTSVRITEISGRPSFYPPISGQSGYYLQSDGSYYWNPNYNDGRSGRRIFGRNR